MTELNNHKFKPGRIHGRCEECGKKHSHLVHRRPRVHAYQTGEVVGNYVVGPRGEFRKIA